MSGQGCILILVFNVRCFIGDLSFEKLIIKAQHEIMALTVITLFVVESVYSGKFFPVKFYSTVT